MAWDHVGKRLYVGGTFNVLGNHSMSSVSIAEWNLATRTLTALPGNAGGLTLDAVGSPGTVHKLVFDMISGCLFVAGVFHLVSGTSCNALAAWHR